MMFKMKLLSFRKFGISSLYFGLHTASHRQHGLTVMVTNPVSELEELFVASVLSFFSQALQ